jgi:hypothetical protein
MLKELMVVVVRDVMHQKHQFGVRGQLMVV